MDDTDRRITRLEVRADEAERERGDIQRALAVIEEAIKYRANAEERWIEESSDAHKDHESRLRSLERVAWALAGTAGASMITAIVSLVHSIGGKP